MPVDRAECVRLFVKLIPMAGVGGVSVWAARGRSVLGARVTARTAAVVAFALAGNLGAVANAAPPPPQHASAPVGSLGVTVTGLTRLGFKKVTAPDTSHVEFAATKTAWPAAASGTLTLSAPAGGAAAGARAHAAGIPVWAQALASKGASAGPGSVGVRVLSHQQASALGISGVVWSLDGAAAGGSVRVGLDYGAFAQAIGGNYASRLTLVQLPGCALSTPALAKCRVRTPLPSSNDLKSQGVSAVLTLGVVGQAATRSAASASSRSAASPVLAGSSVVLAAVSTPGQEGGSEGQYAATPLKAGGSWTAGGSSGSFTYTYPITMPGASSSLVPKADLSYDSGSVDAQTSNTQAQSSWIGDGWSGGDSYIEQSFVPCADSPEGSASPVSSGDECYNGNILTMSLNGSSTALVGDGSSWRLQQDNGATISHVTGSGNGSGTYNTDYWVVTERDGTAYYFGRNQLPGWASGDASTNSVDYEPVYSAHSGDPCYSSAGFTSSVCTTAYKWHLDYVTNTHGQAMAYYYNQAVNYYAQDNGASNAKYISDSYLDHIDYGFNAGAAYGTVPDKVVYGTSVRCVTGSACGSGVTSGNSSNYPDVPFDLICGSSTSAPTSTCTQQAPSFFSTVRLTSITTEQYTGAANPYTAVDTYALTQTEPATSSDTSSSTLFLSQIQRTGNDTTAGGSTASITLPPVTFTGIGYGNRVDTSAYPALTRFRITSVTTEMGGSIGVTYSLPTPCTAAWVQAQTASSASSDTKSCFPVYWTPAGDTSPFMDWFNKYAVQTVLQTDTTGGSAVGETDYQYQNPAWHYDDNEVVQAKYRTYGQFRGYQSVTTTTGSTAEGQTESATTYYQGMDGDWLSSSSTRSVTLTDSQGGTHTDANQLAGETLETTAYLGNGGGIDHSNITSYWVSPATATRSRTGLPALTANATGAVEAWSRQRLTDGGMISWRYNETDTAYDSATGDVDFGLPTYSYGHTVPASAAYDRCTTTTYAPANTGQNLVGLIASTETDSVACAGFTEGSVSSAPSSLNTLTAPAAVARPDQVVSATETFYDDTTFATAFPQTSAPTVGDVTMTRQAVTYASGAFVWQTTAQKTYDAYGRVLTSTDGRGDTTTSGYTVNSAGLTTAATTTNALSQTTAGTLDPERGLTLTATDPNGIVTTTQYDALGRLTSVWLNSRATSATASETYAYTVSDSGVSAVVAGRLLETGTTYATTVTVYDSLGRTRQTQSTPAAGGGRLITDQVYDTHGWVSLKNTAYDDQTTAPTLAVDTLPSGKVPNQDDYVYDGLGRVVYDNSEQDANIVSTTTTVYNGDATTVIPPTGGVEKTTVTDPLGRTSELDEYTATPTLNAPSDPLTGTFYLTGGTKSATTYGYDGHGQQNTVTDALGETWTSAYNIAGQVVSKTDPDAGTSTFLYDADGNLAQTTDAAGTVLSYTYDALNRKTGQYNAALTAQAAGASGNQIAAWVYDNSNNAVSGMTDPIGHLTTETSYSGGSAYTTQYKGFNVFGESTGETYTLPAAEGALADSLSINHTYYTNTGLLNRDVYTAADGLPLEAVGHTYTALDLPAGVSSNLAGYAQPTTYTAYGQVWTVTLGSGSNEATVTDVYDDHTGRLDRQYTSRSTATPAAVDDQTYYYDPAGNTTAETDIRLGSTSTAETQCFAYDTQDRLTTAWTDTAGTTPSSGGGPGGCTTTTVPTAASHSTVGDQQSAASAYWTTWAYDAVGDRTSQTQHSTTGAADTTTAYTYNGNSTNQPHTLTTANTTGATTATSSYTYDPVGNTKTRTTPAGAQTLTWNPTGTLASVATSAGTTSYLYDADGNLLLQKNPTTTTWYVGTEQITLTPATGAITGLRYYPLPGGATAIRTSTPATAFAFEIPSDQHGTNTLTLDSTAQTPTWRQYDPYGNPRGTTTTWIDNRGFLNKVTDTTTGLTDIAARWYDPATGRFQTLDPVLETTDPLALNGYGYTSGNPITYSDPTGLCRYRDGDVCLDPHATPADKASAQGNNPSGTDIGGSDTNGDAGTTGSDPITVGVNAGNSLLGFLINLWDQGQASDPSNPSQGMVNQLDGVNSIRGGYRTGNTQEMEDGITQFGLTFSPLVGLDGAGLALDGTDASLDDARLFAKATRTRFPGDDFKGTGPSVRMTQASIQQAAAKYGIDLTGYGQIKIMNTRAGFAGWTAPNRQIYLARDAFKNDQVLARTLVHEMYHVDQLRAGARYPLEGENTDPWEAPAYAYEQQWWESVSGGN